MGFSNKFIKVRKLFTRKRFQLSGCFVFLILYILLFVVTRDIIYSPEVIAEPPESNGEASSKSKEEGRKLATEHLNSMGKMSLSVAWGGLWALLLLKGNRVRIRSFAEWGLFWLANLFLGSAFIVYVMVVEDLASQLYFLGDFNPSEGKPNELMVCLKLFFYVGVFHVGYLAITCLEDYDDEN